MLPEITMQLAGRIGNWRVRIVRGQARAVWSGWLRTAQSGLIGVYVLAKPGVRLTQALPSNTWVHVQGTLCPLRVYALADDPRAPDEDACAPLLVHAVQLRRCRRGSAPALLDAPATLRVRSGRRRCAGQLARAAQMTDVYHLSADGHSRGPTRTWSALRGVSAMVGPHRYLRYIVLEGTYGTG